MSWNDVISAVTGRRPKRSASKRRRGSRRSAATTFRGRLGQFSKDSANRLGRVAHIDSAPRVDVNPAEVEQAGRALEEKVEDLELERASLRARLDHHKERAERVARATAHDLKSPLSTLETVLERLTSALESGEGVEEALTLARLATVTGARMRSRIDDVLTPVPNRRLDNKKESVDLEMIVEHAVLRHAAEVALKDIKVVVRRPFPSFFGNRKDIATVLDNLVENSVKYAQPMGGEIEIGVRQLGDGEALFVRDDGSGFDPSAREAAFEPNRRLSNVADGSGMGLAIVRETAEAWGGEVRIDTEPGAGTIVYVSLGDAAQEPVTHTNQDAVTAAAAAEDSGGATA